MRTLLRLSLLAALFLVPAAQAQIRLGAVYGTETEIGGQVGFGFTVPIEMQGQRLGAIGTLTVYAPESADAPGFAETSLIYGEVAVEGVYGFRVTESLDTYALAGPVLAFARTSVDFENENLEDKSDVSTDVGVNVGAGINFGLLYAEARYSLGGFQQFQLALGVQF